MKIRAVIVDDEAHARARIRQSLKGETDFDVVAECASGRQALAEIPGLEPDLAFLDIHMPQMTGFDLCEALRNSGAAMPLVVFVTAYDKFALKAFEVHAMDYLLKPFDRERFQKTLARVREQLSDRRAAAEPDRLAGLIADLRAGLQQSDRLVFKENGKVVILRAEAIDWLEADGNYVRVHAGPGSHYVRDTLAGLEAQLPAGKFMRITRSAIVNLDRVKEFQPLFYGDYSVVLLNGTKLSMSRTYKGGLEKILGRRS